MSNPAKGKHSYNNGNLEKYSFECPEGWEQGRLKKLNELLQKEWKRIIQCIICLRNN